MTIVKEVMYVVGFLCEIIYAIGIIGVFFTGDKAKPFFKKHRTLASILGIMIAYGFIFFVLTGIVGITF